LKTRKYLNSSVRGMIEPFAMLIEQQQELFLGPILTEHDFLALMIILSTFTSRSHNLSNFSNVQIEGVISRMSSSYRITYIPVVNGDDLARLSKYIAKREGYKTEPCLTPKLIENNYKLDKSLNHFTHEWHPDSQNSSKLISSLGTSLFN